MTKPNVGVYKGPKMKTYKYVLLHGKEGQKVMDAHINDEYCAIIAVDNFRIRPDEITKQTFPIVPNKFYDQNEVEFTNPKLVAKVVNGEWVKYD